MPIATGEVYAFPEGKLYLYASASGTNSGSGIAFVRNTTLTFIYGWQEQRDIAGNYANIITGQRATLSVENMLGDLTLFRLANITAAVNARFESLATGGIGQSAQWTLYSGVVDTVSVSVSDGDLFVGSYSMYARQWSAVGQ